MSLSKTKNTIFISGANFDCLNENGWQNDPARQKII